MSERKCLVTGASGDTGRYAIETLLKQDLPVRALVHRDGEEAIRLRRAGAEVVLGDLFDPNKVREALDGISAAYFVYPIEPGLIDATAYFCERPRRRALALP